MNSEERISVRVPAAVKDGLDQLADEWDSSRSELVREQLKKLVRDGSEELPEHVRVRLARDRIKNESAPDKYRGFFRKNMFSHGMDAWNAGLSPQEGRVVLKSFLTEHEMLFEEFGEEDELDPEKIRGWAEGFIELFHICSVSDGYDENELKAYLRQFPYHFEVLTRAATDARAEYRPTPDEVTGWEPPSTYDPNPSGTEE